MFGSATWKAVSRGPGASSTVWPARAALAEVLAVDPIRAGSKPTALSLSWTRGHGISTRGSPVWRFPQLNAERHRCVAARPPRAVVGADPDRLDRDSRLVGGAGARHYVIIAIEPLARDSIRYSLRACPLTLPVPRPATLSLDRVLDESPPTPQAVTVPLPRRPSGVAGCQRRVEQFRFGPTSSPSSSRASTAPSATEEKYGWSRGRAAIVPVEERASLAVAARLWCSFLIGFRGRRWGTRTLTHCLVEDRQDGELSRLPGV